MTTLASIALRFLRLGATAWGGPIVQIAALHEELVVHDRIVDESRFRKALAVCQALPGPEATEMCIWAGTVVRGRLGGLVAGLGFVMPGFVAMLLVSWFLLEREPWPRPVVAAFAGMQAAVVALVVRAASRLFAVATTNWSLRAIAITAALGAFADVPFAASLVGGGLVAMAMRVVNSRTRLGLVAAIAIAWCVLAVVTHGPFATTTTSTPITPTTTPTTPSLAALLTCGLRAGTLTFGGAYTAIPFLHADAVGGGWMTEEQFLSGLAVGGVLPAPMIIVGTWVGQASGGLAGALLVTLGIFLPAFVLPLLLHHHLERIVANARWHAFLDGVTAAVTGLVAAIAVDLLRTLDTPLRVTTAATALAVLLLVRHRLVVLPVMAVAALAGLQFG